MGDRCYMTVRCRRQDVKAFEDIGFHIDSEDDGSQVVDLIDEEANYAHSGSMPENVPWTGRSEAGGTYGPSEYACDGKKLLEIGTGTDGGYVIGWDKETDRPSRHDIQQVEAFRAMDKKVSAMLEVAEKPIENPS